MERARNKIERINTDVKKSDNNDIVDSNNDYILRRLRDSMGELS